MKIDVTYSRQMSTLYLFGRISLRLTRERIEKHLYILVLQIVPVSKKVKKQCNGDFNALRKLLNYDFSQLVPIIEIS